MPHGTSHAERASTLQLINFTSLFMLREQDNEKVLWKTESFWVLRVFIISLKLESFSELFSRPLN